MSVQSVAPSQFGLIREDENSGTVWMKIRLAMKPRIDEMSYWNFFRRSRHRDLLGTTLIIDVQDGIVAEFLARKYMPQLTAAIASLSLPVERIQFEVANRAPAAAPK